MRKFLISGILAALLLSFSSALAAGVDSRYTLVVRFTDSSGKALDGGRYYVDRISCNTRTVSTDTTTLCDEITKFSKQQNTSLDIGSNGTMKGSIPFIVSANSDADRRNTSFTQSIIAHVSDTTKKGSSPQAVTFTFSYPKNSPVDGAMTTTAKTSLTGGTQATATNTTPNATKTTGAPTAGTTSAPVVGGAATSGSTPTSTARTPLPTTSAQPIGFFAPVVLKCKLKAGCDNVMNLLNAVINVLVSVSGILFIGMLFYGGIRYLANAGVESETNKAKATMLGAIIGLAIVLVSWAVLRVILARFTTGG